MELKRGEHYEMGNARDAVRIRRGRLRVFVICRGDGIRRRPMHLITAEEGQTIPGFFFRDDDHVLWTFRLEAEEDVHLQFIENGTTKVLLRRFMAAAELGDVSVDAFADALMERYESRVIAEDVFVTGSEKERQKLRQHTEETISGILRRRNTEQEEKVGRPGREHGMEGAGPERRMEGAGPERRMEDRPSRPRDMGVWNLLRQQLAEGILQKRDLLRPKRLAVKLQVKAYSNCLAAGGRFFAGAPSTGGYEKTTATKAIITDVLGIYDASQTCLTSAYRCLLCAVLSIFGMGLALWQSGISSDRTGLASSGASLWSGAILLMAAFTLAVGILYHVEHKRSGPLRHRIASMRAEEELDMYQFLRGIEKIRLSGAEEYIIDHHYRRVASRKQLEWQYQWRRLPFLSMRKPGLWIFVMLLLMVGPVSLSIKTGGDAAWAGADAGSGLVAGDTAWPALAAGAASLLGFTAFVQGTAALSQGRRLKELLLRCGWAEPEEGREIEELPEDPDVILEADGVEFSYGEEPVLQGISLKLARGERVGIAGRSGCGKTTLLRILAGLERPDRGTIRRRPMRQSMVLQQEKLMTGSMLENIGGQSAGRYDQASILRALEDTGLLKDLERMPMGIETVIRDTGDTISAGQRQKILLARALATDPQLLLLDEAESDLDDGARKQIRKTLRDRDMTCLIVSHDLRTLAECDRVLIFEGGRLREEDRPMKVNSML